MTDPTSNTQATSIGTEELVQALNELLEAERAGARVTRETAQQIPTSLDLPPQKQR